MSMIAYLERHPAFPCKDNVTSCYLTPLCLTEVCSVGTEYLKQTMGNVCETIFSRLYFSDRSIARLNQNGSESSSLVGSKHQNGRRVTIHSVKLLQCKFALGAGSQSLAHDFLRKASKR
jgi:hypothetical protein